MDRERESGDGAAGSSVVDPRQETASEGAGAGNSRTDARPPPRTQTTTTTADEESRGYATSTTDTKPTTSKLYTRSKEGEEGDEESSGRESVRPSPREKTTKVVIKTRQDDDRYFMKHKRRGIAIIFNHENFDYNPDLKREGADNDCQSLTNSFQRLGFEVRLFKDLKCEAVGEVLAQAASEDHADNDCLLVAVMSHGGEGGEIYAADHVYSSSQLWSGFMGKKCRSLIGKPKLFFIQACRGEGTDDGNDVCCDSVDGRSHYSIPDEADFLVMHSTTQGYYSWKNEEKGSWFMQALCKELDENAFEKDLQTMLTAVIRRVALYNKSHVPGKPERHQKMQVPELTSRLTRSVYFLPPTREDRPQTANKEDLETK